VYKTKTLEHAIVKLFFWKFVLTDNYYQIITVAHSLMFFTFLKEEHFFTALTTKRDALLISNSSLIFDSTTIIFDFLIDKVVFEI
jgi:hypothetical protein